MCGKMAHMLNVNFLLFFNSNIVEHQYRTKRNNLTDVLFLLLAGHKAMAHRNEALYDENLDGT